MLAAMEEVVPVCDRFLTLGRFSTTQLMIALGVILIRNSLHSTRGERVKNKNKVETPGIRGESMFFATALA
jgi:hypothetical protein